MKRFLLPAISAAMMAAFAAGCATTKADTTKAAEKPAASPAAASTPAPATIIPLAPKPAIVTPQEWGSTPDPMEHLRQTPRRITIHHAGEVWKTGSDPFKVIKNLQSWGKAEKKWPDVPYHFLISPDGRIFEGRPIVYRPDTNTDYSLDGHVGIDVWGNFEVQRIDKVQLESLVKLVAWLCNEYKIDPATIAGHKDAAPGQTVCPGKDFYRYVHDGLIRQWVEQTLKGETPAIALLLPAEGGPTDFIKP